jgi:hypothetical protein
MSTAVPAPRIKDSKRMINLGIGGESSDGPEESSEPYHCPT